MGYSKYLIRIIIQVILIAVTGLLFALAITHKFMVVTSASLAILWVVQILLLIVYINKIKRDLLQFIDALKNQDTSFEFKKAGEDQFLSSIHQGFNEVMRDFRVIRKEKELESQFFLHVMEHIGTGLLVIDESKRIRLANKAFYLLFGVDAIHRLEELQTIQLNLPHVIGQLGQGRQKSVILQQAGKKTTLSLYATEFKLGDEWLKIVSFQDISKEISKTELESWNKLFRVITHEVMNSLSPIRLLSSGMLSMCSQVGAKSDIQAEFHDGLTAIKNRAESLSHFIERYKQLTRLPEPQRKKLSVLRLFKQVETLLAKALKEKGISLNISATPGDVEVCADEKQLEQVLINLVKNAMEAMENMEAPFIELQAMYTGQGLPVIRVSNNGKPIPQEIREHMFVPFFTTKQCGSGIGLSLSRQVMRLHDGELVYKELGGMTVFELGFGG